jgi:hypothetical protein
MDRHAKNTEKGCSVPQEDSEELAAITSPMNCGEEHVMDDERYSVFPN